MQVKTFFDPVTFTLTYLVWHSESKDAAIIDSVLDFDSPSGKFTTSSVEKLIEFAHSLNLNIRILLETHAHADHLSGSQWLKKHYSNTPIAIGRKITEVQSTFKRVFNLDLKTDGSQFDRLLEDEEILELGQLNIKALATPGHTPACMSYLIGDCVFTGDAIFMPDSGTGRCDFPAGSAEMLYQSIQKLYRLPDSTKVFVGHDYQPSGRELKFQTTIGEQKNSNIHIKADTKKEDFIAFRNQRDQTLTAPKLLLPSIQVNINAGNLPKPEDNGVCYLKLPIVPSYSGSN